MNFLICVGIWVGIGLLCTFLRMCVFFRGPRHMVDCYLSHPRTTKRVCRVLLQIRSQVKDDSKVIPYYIKVCFIVGAILAPGAVIEMILDFFTFVSFDPNKKGTDDEQG